MTSRATATVTRSRLAIAAALGCWSVVAGAQHARVRGTVFDSVGRDVLAGAMVQFVGVAGGRDGTVYAVRTDSLGAYRLDSLPPGRYLAGFFHQAADSLGIESTPRRVELRSGEQEIALGTPSPASLMRALCPSSQEDSTSLLLGHVRDARTEAAVETALVRVEWLETTIDRSGVKTRERGDSVSSTSSGFFSLCGLPSDVPLLSRVMRGADSSGFVEVEVPPAGVRHVTLYLGGARRVASGAVDAIDSSAVAAPIWRGQARLSGTVRDASGQAVSGARVVILGAGIEGVANERGIFALDSLPAGSFTLEVRALGFTPVRRLVQLLERAPLSVAVEVGVKIFTLPTEIVRGELVYSRQLLGFERRRRTQFTGKFMTPREIQARPLTTLSGLLSSMQGVEVTRRGGYSLVVMRREGENPGLEYCAPSLWIDGLIDLAPDFDRLWSDGILVIEVYPRAKQRPFEFTDRTDCGAIAVWSRPKMGPRSPSS